MEPEQIGPLVFVENADYPYPFEVAAPPRFWMEETTGQLAAAIEVYMRSEPLSAEQLELIKLYLRQYVERAVIAQDADDGSRMTDQQVRDEVLTLFLAGHETTAGALSWTWYLLARHPEVEARLADELREVLGGRPPTVADLPAIAGVTFQAEPDAHVFTLSITRAEVEAEAEAAAAAEPEVVGAKGKKEEEEEE